MHGALMHCLDVNLTIPVLVPLGLLLQDVELDIGGEAAGGFSRASALQCRGSSMWPCGVVVVLCRGVGVLSAVVSTTNQTRATCGR